MSKKRIELISVVDDDSVYVFTMKMIGESLNLADKMMFFKHGGEALEYLTTHLPNNEKLPDIILLDMNMPVMDGWEFLAAFCKVKPTIKKDITVYMVSSSIDQKDIDRAASLSDLSGYFIKPLNPKNIEKVLKGEYENQYGVPLS